MIHGLSRNAKLVISLAVLYLFWGGSYLVTSIGVQSLPPFLMGAVRFTLSGLALFALARFFGEDRPRLNSTEWRHLAITGFLTVLVSNGFNSDDKTTKILILDSGQINPANKQKLFNVFVRVCGIDAQAAMAEVHERRRDRQIGECRRKVYLRQSPCCGADHACLCKNR